MSPDRGRAPLAARLALATLGLALAAVLAESAARLADGNALPQLAAYTYAPDGRVVLADGVDLRVRRPDGGMYRVRTEEHGLRSTPTPSHRLVVGDSQVFGSGVEDHETFAAQLGAYNAGVPGYGLLDALAQAEALVGELDLGAVYIVVDQANDWDDGLALAAERYVVRNGWLLTQATAASRDGQLWGTPLARSHLFFLARASLVPKSTPTALTGAPDAPIGPPAFLDPDPAVTVAFADRIRAFARAHPELRTVAVWLPVDAATSAERAPRSPFALGDARPWTDTRLRDSLASALAEVPMIDLLPALRDPACFLDRDFHLSPKGHAAVAAALAAELR